jgi:acetylornithine aminotransferase
LLFDKKVFTGEAKPNVIRLLPSLAITKEQIDVFLQTVRELAAIK